MLTLFELFGSVFLFGAVTPLVFSTAPLMFITRFCSDAKRTLGWTFQNVIEKDRAMLLYLLAGTDLGVRGPRPS